MVVNRRAVLMEPDAPCEQFSPAIGRCAGSHNAGRPCEQGWQWPQLGMNTMTT